MTTTELPPKTVPCPRCEGTNYQGDCEMCGNTGNIPDPLLAEWFDQKTTPARMRQLLSDRADDKLMREFCIACCNRYLGERNWHLEHTNLSGEDWAASWMTVDQGHFESEYLKGSADIRGDFLRCLFAPPAMPREMVECPECEGHYSSADGRQQCNNCNEGKVPAPIIDPRWKSATVLDLAKRVRGYNAREAGEYACDVCGNMPDDEGWLEHGRGCYTQSEDGGGGELIEEAVTQPPQPIHGILADALQDAGCDNRWVIEHLMQPDHVAGKCWVVDEILKGVSSYESPNNASREGSPA